MTREEHVKASNYLREKSGGRLLVPAVNTNTVVIQIKTEKGNFRWKQAMPPTYDSLIELLDRKIKESS